MSNNSNAGNAGRMIRSGGFISRLLAYAFFYVPIALVWIWIATANGLDDYETWGGYGYIDKSTLAILVVSIMVLTPMLPLIIWEMSVRRFRKKHGLSVWKNIEENLRQMTVNERVGREYKTHQALDKTDIAYWHKLLKDGAITEAEYDAKKKELL